MRRFSLALNAVVVAGTVCGAVLWTMACGGPAAPARDIETPQAVVPHVSINQVMVSMVDNAGHVLWDVEREGMAPKDDADWLEVESHAAQLAAAATLIQLGGTGQADAGWIRQAGWREHAEMMGGAAVAAMEAARSRNLEALVKANGELVASCENCHRAFKPELPSEGILHQRPHSDSHVERR